jgi:hypothetical protein
MAHNGHVADVDWDGWLDRLIEDAAGRQVTDVRAYLITEISRAMAGRDALRTGDAYQLAQIAVDVMIASARRMGIRPS